MMIVDLLESNIVSRKADKNFPANYYFLYRIIFAQFLNLAKNRLVIDKINQKDYI